jgi:hypothetical protein
MFVNTSLLERILTVYVVQNSQNYWVFGLSFLRPEDGNRSSFRNVVFSRIPDDGESPKT